MNAAKMTLGSISDFLFGLFKKAVLRRHTPLCPIERSFVHIETTVVSKGVRNFALPMGKLSIKWLIIGWNATDGMGKFGCGPAIAVRVDMF